MDFMVSAENSLPTECALQKNFKLNLRVFRVKGMKWGIPASSLSLASERDIVGFNATGSFEKSIFGNELFWQFLCSKVQIKISPGTGLK